MIIFKPIENIAHFQTYDTNRVITATNNTLKDILSFNQLSGCDNFWLISLHCRTRCQLGVIKYMYAISDRYIVMQTYLHTTSGGR